MVIELRACRARHKFDYRGSCLRAHDASDDACGVAAVLCAGRGVDLVVEVGVGVHEGDVFVDAASPDVAFLAHLSATEPSGGAPVNGSDVAVVAAAADPKPG